VVLHVLHSHLMKMALNGIYEAVFLRNQQGFTFLAYHVHTHLHEIMCKTMCYVQILNNIL